MESSSAYWCHQCLAETVASPSLGSAHGELICPTCGSSFVEAMESALSLSHVQHSVRRQERRRQLCASLRRLGAHLAEAESTNAVAAAPDLRTEVSRFVHLMDHGSLHSRFSGFNNTASSGETLPSLGAALLDVYEPDHDFDSTSSDHARAGTFGMFLDAVGRSSEFDERMSNSFGGHVDASDAASDAGLHNNEPSRQIGAGWNAEWQDDSGSENLRNENSDEEELDFDEETGMLENRSWDSFEEDHAQEWHIENVSSRLRWFVHERNLQDPALDVDLDSLHLDNYVGNPGDYVDAHGFEELLQQFADSDNTHRAAPPAGKAIIEGLPTVFVQQKNVDDGSAMCAICKDVIAFDEPAKQLPCLHLYHCECILPWLGARNSCPVCRYELPTDDPDYEEQRRSKDMQQSRQQEPGGVSNASTLSGDEASTLSSDAGREATSSTEGHGNEEPVETESDEIFLDASKEEIINEDGADGSECETDGPFRVRFSLRDVISSSLFSVVGVVAISCIGNILMGGSCNRSTVGCQVGRGRDLTRRRRSWWVNPFG